MSTLTPTAPLAGSHSLANGTLATRKESRVRKGWNAFDVWQDRVRRAAAEAARSAQLDAHTAGPAGSWRSAV